MVAASSLGKVLLAIRGVTLEPGSGVSLFANAHGGHCLKHENFVMAFRASQEHLIKPYHDMSFVKVQSYLAD